jgi:hypothetical protein
MPRFLVAVAFAAGLGVIASAQQQAPPATPADQPIFRSSTRLIVTTVSVKDKDGKPIEGLTAKDFVITEDGMPQDIAFVEYQTLATEAAPALVASDAPAPAAARLRPAAPEVPVGHASRSSPAGAGDTKYREQAAADSLLRSLGDADRRSAARLPGGSKYVSSQMTHPDLMAIMTYEGGSVASSRTSRPTGAVIRNVIDVLVYGEDKDGDGVRDEPDQSSAFGQGDAEFNIFNTDRQLAALQTA